MLRYRGIRGRMQVQSRCRAPIFSVLQGHGPLLSTLCTRTTVRGAHVEGGQASRHTSIHMSVCVCTKQSLDYFLRATFPHFPCFAFAMLREAHLCACLLAPFLLGLSINLSIGRAVSLVKFRLGESGCETRETGERYISADIRPCVNYTLYLLIKDRELFETLSPYLFSYL